MIRKQIYKKKTNHLNHFEVQYSFDSHKHLAITELNLVYEINKTN